jgi:hypothetical protein
VFTYQEEEERRREKGREEERAFREESRVSPIAT